MNWEVVPGADKGRGSACRVLYTTDVDYLRESFGVHEVDGGATGVVIDSPGHNLLTFEGDGGWAKGHAIFYDSEASHESLGVQLSLHTLLVGIMSKAVGTVFVRSGDACACRAMALAAQVFIEGGACLAVL